MDTAALRNMTAEQGGAVMCRHEESLHGRCTVCGMTWAEQAKQRKCSSLLPDDVVKVGPGSLHACYLPDGHDGRHENYLGTRVWGGK